MTDEQHAQSNMFFIHLQDKYIALFGLDYMATIRRFRLIVIRIAMIFTALYILITGDFSELQTCWDTDFQAALSMVKILVKHSSHVFFELQKEVKPTKSDNNKVKFLDKLPLKFTCTKFVDLAKHISINERTAERYMGVFCEKG